MTALELQYFEIIDMDITAVEARIYVDGVCARVFRNFEEEWCGRGLYGNQAEKFELPNETAAVAFLKSSGSYEEICDFPAQSR